MENLIANYQSDSDQEEENQVKQTIQEKKNAIVTAPAVDVEVFILFFFFF